LEGGEVGQKVECPCGEKFFVSEDLLVQPPEPAAELPSEAPVEAAPLAGPAPEPVIQPVPGPVAPAEAELAAPVPEHVVAEVAEPAAELLPEAVGQPAPEHVVAAEVESVAEPPPEAPVEAVPLAGPAPEPVTQPVPGPVAPAEVEPAAPAPEPVAPAEVEPVAAPPPEAPVEGGPYAGLGPEPVTQPAPEPGAASPVASDAAEDDSDTEITITWDEAVEPAEGSAGPAHTTSVTFPEVIGKARVIREIGRGSIGVVFLAEHTILHIPVALKIISPRLAREKEMVDRFYREARTAAKLNHPNIVRVLNCDNEDGILFIVMEHVDGPNLKNYIQENGPFSPQQSLKVVHSVALALQEAEKHNIIHRDIKPDNIMISEKKEYKLADLGLAREVASTSTSAEVTTVSMGMGTPHYMSPEQAFDARNVDIRADIYSLGCTLYYLLCGEPPYPEPDIKTVLFKHLNAPVPLIREKAPEVPAAVERIICKCMAKEPEDRYQHADELLRDLDIARRKRKGALLAASVAAKSPRSGTVVDKAAVPSPEKASSPAEASRSRPVWLSPKLWIALFFVISAAVGGVWFTRRPKSAGATEEAPVLAGELKSLDKKLENQTLLPEQRAMLLYKKAGNLVRLERTDEALNSFAQALDATKQLPDGSAAALLPDFRSALEWLVSALEQSPGKLEECLFLLAPRIADSFGEEHTTLEPNLVKRLAQPLHLHCEVTPLAGFKVRFEYRFDSVDELTDFIQPSEDWAVTLDGKWVERKEHWQIRSRTLVEAESALQVNVDYPSALYWNVPHRNRFLIRYRAGNLPNSQDLGCLSFMCCSSGIPSLSYADNGVRLVVAGASNSHNAVMGNETEVVTTAPFTVLGKDVVSVEIEGDLPHLRLKVNDEEVFNGNLPDALASDGRHLGPITMWKSRYMSLVIETPVTDLIYAAQKGRSYVYPLMGRGTERFDLKSTCFIDELAVLEGGDPDKWRSLEGEDVKKLSGANGQYVRFDGKQPALYAKFPVSPEIRKSPRRESMQVDVYAVSRFTTGEGRNLPGAVELFNNQTQAWVRNDAASGRASKSQNCYLTRFTFRSLAVGQFLNPENELLLRHFEPSMESGTLRMGHVAVKF